jgi:putative ABC transport system substrate-binding protein
VALRELGYVHGRNVVVERRFADGRIDRLPQLTREPVRLQMDVIVALSEPAVQAAKDTTATIPIVMMFGGDPVARGWVASLSRPAGNITGVTTAGETALAGKRLEFIMEAVPGVARIAALAIGGPITDSSHEAQKAASSAPSREWFRSEVTRSLSSRAPSSPATESRSLSEPPSTACPRCTTTRKRAA